MALTSPLEEQNEEGVNMNPQDQTNECPPSEYPPRRWGCWKTGGAWYKEWITLHQKRMDFSELCDLIVDAKKQLRQTRCRWEPNDEQHHQALRRHYNAIGCYNALKVDLDRNSWLERSMKGLGAYMRRKEMVYQDDIPAFPLDWSIPSRPHEGAILLAVESGKPPVVLLKPLSR